MSSRANLISYKSDLTEICTRMFSGVQKPFALKCVRGPVLILFRGFPGGFGAFLSPKVQYGSKYIYDGEFEKTGFLTVFESPVPRKMFPKWILFCIFDLLKNTQTEKLN